MGMRVEHAATNAAVFAHFSTDRKKKRQNCEQREVMLGLGYFVCLGLVVCTFVHFVFALNRGYGT